MLIPNPFENAPTPAPKPPATDPLPDTSSGAGFRIRNPLQDLQLEEDYDRDIPDGDGKSGGGVDGDPDRPIIVGPYVPPMDGGSVSLDPLTPEQQEMLDEPIEEGIESVIPELTPYTGALPRDPTPPKPTTAPDAPAAGTTLGDILFEAGPPSPTPKEPTPKKEEPPVEQDDADAGTIGQAGDQRETDNILLGDIFAVQNPLDSGMQANTEMIATFTGSTLYFPTQASKGDAASTLNQQRTSIGNEQSAATNERNSYMYSMSPDATPSQCGAWRSRLDGYSHDYALRENAWRAVSHRYMAVLEAPIGMEIAYTPPAPEPTIWSMDGKEIPNPLYPGNAHSITGEGDTPVTCPPPSITFSVGPSR